MAWKDIAGNGVVLLILLLLILFSIQVIQIRLAVLSTRLPQPLSYHAVTTTEQDFGIQKEYSEVARRVILLRFLWQHWLFVQVSL